MRIHAPSVPRGFRGVRPGLLRCGAPVAAALLLALLLPAPAAAVSLTAPAEAFERADVAARLGAGEPGGLALLMVDDVLAASARIGPSASVTFTAVPLTAGPRRVSVLVRSTAGLTASPASLVRTWSRPATPTVSGVCPAFCAKITKLSMRTDWSTRSLSVMQDGRRVWSQTFPIPESVAPTIALPAGSTTVVLLAENAYASSTATLTLTRPTWPAPGRTRLTSYFGWRLHPILGTRRFHAGIDIAAPSGSPIVAAGDGTVVFAGASGGYGSLTMLDHGNGVMSLYGHQSSISVKQGQRVLRGQRIGSVGSTGLSTGPHLHFEVRVNGSPADPLRYL